MKTEKRTLRKKRLSTALWMGAAFLLLTACAELSSDQPLEQDHHLVVEGAHTDVTTEVKEVETYTEAETNAETATETNTETEMEGIGEGEHSQLLPLEFLEELNRPHHVFSFVYDNGDYHQMEGVKAQTFFSQNALGESLYIQQVEKEGRVYFVMEEAEKLVSYQGPATDFLYDRMVEAASQPLQRQQEMAEGTLYEYWIPFHHDEELTWRYQFVMVDDTLASLHVYFEDDVWQHYEFHHFGTILVEDLGGTSPGSFHIPRGIYQEDHFEGVYDSDKAPPWWEVF